MKEKTKKKRKKKQKKKNKRKTKENKKKKDEKEVEQDGLTNPKGRHSKRFKTLLDSKCYITYNLVS